MNKKKPTRNPTQQQQPLRERSIGSSRPMSGGGKGSIPPHAQSDEESIYDNKRFTHACTTLVGAPVSIETTDGHIYEGIFRVFSPRLELTLDVAHLIDPSDPGRISEDSVQSMVFHLHDVVRCSAIDTDLDYATKDGFQTDAQITGAKSNGEIQLKQLEQWEPEGSDDTDLHDLNSGDANGWKAEEMFAYNERNYGVQSTYKANLEGYTIQLNPDRNSEEYREREAKAIELAREIEGNQSSRSAVELENGDEEEAFSAVVRPQRPGDRNSAEHDRESKYIPPARRQNSNPGNAVTPGGGGGREPVRDNRNTGTGPRLHNAPSHHGSSSSSPPGGPHNRTPLQQQQHPRRTDRDYNTPPSSMSPHAASSTSSSHSARDHHGSASHGHHHDDYGPSGGGGSANNRGGGRNSYSRENNRTDHDTPQQQRGMGSNRGGGVNSSGPQGRQMQNRIEDLKDFKNNFHLAPTTPSSNVVNVSVSPETSPKLSQQQQPPPPHVSHMPHQQHPPQHMQQQQAPRGRSPPLSDRKATPPLVSADQRQSVSPPQHHQMQQQPPQQNVASPIVNSFQRQKSETETGLHNTSVGQQEMSPTSNNTSGSTSSASPVSSTTSTGPATVKKSNLNPNAKEFVLNPNAKVFIPGAAGPAVSMSPGRPPISATPPQRPMTPATPTIPMTYTTNQMAPHHLMGTGVPGGMQLPHQQFIHYVPTSMTGPAYSTGHQVSPYPAFHQNSTLTVSQAPIHQQQQHQQQQQQQQQLNQQRYRAIPNSNQGPRVGVNPGDVTSPNHVLAATGPPILAQMSAASPSQPPSYMQYPPQAHPQQFANMAAMMQQANQQGMLMRFPHMMVSQSPTTPQMPITTMSGMVDGSGGHPNMTIAWMQQGQAPPPHMPGVPPPPPNSMGAPHLGQPPPQTAAGQQHNPSSVANSAQVAAVQAAVAQQQQQQQQQQQVGNNGGGHTPAPSPGPMAMYSTSGPQSLPHQFSTTYPGGVFMLPHGSPHPVMQQTIISSQGQGVPPPHHMHQYPMQQVIPGQQNAPHQLIIHPAMAAQHAAVTAAAQAAGNQGQPQSGGPGAPQ